MNTYANLEVIVIDPNREMLLSMRTMLRKMGFDDANITQMNSVNSSRSLIENHNFDVIICSYLVDSTPSGATLLTNLRQQNLMQPTTGFIFTEVDNYLEIKRDIIEAEPDGIIVKPFNYNDFKQQVASVVKLKQQTRSIDLLIADNDFDAAIALCDSNVQSKPRLKNVFLRKKLQILFGIKKDYKQASILAKELGLETSSEWAKLKALESYLQIGDDTEANVIAQEFLLADVPPPRKIMELNANLSINEGDQEEAIEILKKATIANPDNIELKIKLVGLYFDNDQYENAEKLLKAIDLNTVDNERHRVRIIELRIICVIFIDGAAAQRLKLYEHCRKELDATTADKANLSDYFFYIASTLLKSEIVTAIPTLVNEIANTKVTHRKLFYIYALYQMGLIEIALKALTEIEAKTPKNKLVGTVILFKLITKLRCKIEAKDDEIELVTMRINQGDLFAFYDHVKLVPAIAQNHLDFINFLQKFIGEHQLPGDVLLEQAQISYIFLKSKLETANDDHPKMPDLQSAYTRILTKIDPTDK
jgi:CheY-like chemotaxis protein